MQTGLSPVFTAATYTPSASTGYAANTIVLTTPFNWDGVSNLIIETCFNNTTDATSAVFNQTATSYVSSLVYRADNATVCSSTTSTYSYSQRPNMRFGGTVATGSGFTWNWTPGNLTGNSVTVNPTTTTTYTVTGTNTTTGCSNTSTVTVSSVLPAVSATAVDSLVCTGSSTKLTANVTGGAPFTYSWKDASNTVIGTTASINVSPTANTTYSVTVTDACGNNATSTVPITISCPGRLHLELV
jgi:hypothetical protein